MGKQETCDALYDFTFLAFLLCLFFRHGRKNLPSFAGAVMGFIVPGNYEAYRERRAGERNALDTSGGGGGQENKGISELSLILRISLPPGLLPGNLYVGCWDPASEAQSYSGTEG